MSSEAPNMSLDIVPREGFKLVWELVHSSILSVEALDRKLREVIGPRWLDEGEWPIKLSTNSQITLELS